MQITKRLEFDAAHRLLAHKGLCHNLHGHRYAIEVTVESPGPTGLVLDFADLSQRIKERVCQLWDHATLLEHGDPLVETLEQMGLKHDVLNGAPTAELMAMVAFALLDIGTHPTWSLCRVRIYETPTSWADAEV